MDGHTADSHSARPNRPFQHDYTPQKAELFFAIIGGGGGIFTPIWPGNTCNQHKKMLSIMSNKNMAFILKFDLPNLPL